MTRCCNENTELNSRILIFQQIAKVGEDNEKHTIDDLKERILKLKVDLKEKERKIVEMEKRTSSFDNENQHIKVVEICVPNLLTLKFHRDIE